MCGGVKNEKPLFIHELHFDVIATVVSQNVSWVVMRSLRMGNAANRYPNHQWYDDTSMMKNEKL
jgi:hypothetical protein